MDDSHLYLEASHLISRGWSRSLVERFLGQPDRWLPVNHWANYQGKRAYFLERVQQVEASESFREAFERSLRMGRRVSRGQSSEFVRVRESNQYAFNRWRDSLTDDDKRVAAVLSKAAEVFEEARRRGYRTPHKGGPRLELKIDWS
jgi:hypothetical protein